MEIELHPTSCAICGTEGRAAELYPANFSIKDFDATVFSARRLPDRIHYRMVKCRACGLVRADPAAGSDLLAQLYHESTFEYAGEIESLRRTYGRYLTKLDRHGVRKRALLEIGCGNGFFLEEARRRGYSDVCGLEPSQHAIANAAPEIGCRIVHDTMRPGVFDSATFDVICLFQVFDHLPDPEGVLRECRRILRSGGLMLILNHNVEAVSARLLGRRSPIIDIEHTYLYSPRTLARLVEKEGFQAVESGTVWNSYHLQYLVRLFPFEASLKKTLLRILARSGLGRWRFRVPLGNLYLISRAP